MKRVCALLIFIIAIVGESQAQFTRYIINFKDKSGSPYSLSSPQAYLSQRAIDRRNRYGIAIDSTDLPVTPSYVTQIRNVANVTILNVSKWLNSVSIQTTDPNAITTINGFPFVKTVTVAAAKFERQSAYIESKIETDFSSSASLKSEKTTSDYFNYGTGSFNEIHLLNGEFLHDIGLRGQGMQIAMLDNGFNNYTSPTLHSFDSANANNQVIGTWDFVAHEQNVSNDGSHGMSCFSTIVANIPGQFVGTAPKANFWLYQTEDNSGEYPIEEHTWACGAEKADSSGADIISSSLGYSTFDSASLDHTYADMNGNTTMAAIAGDLAAKKGMLVFIANGNSGTSSWHYLTTPADGDSIIAVGAVSSTGVVGNFSSYGPSSDGQVKPDLASVGVSALIQSLSGTINTGNGTSFACPKMAGLGTCLWQGFPEFSNMKIRKALWDAGSITTSPDDRIGYGIPNMKAAFLILLKDFSTANGSISNCTTSLSWTSKDISAMKYEIERKVFGETNYTKIADIPAQQNTLVLANHSYQKTDTLINVQAGTVSYRIRQIVDTAAISFTAAYIDTVNITLGTSCGVDLVNSNAEKISIIPNPAPGQTTLRISTSYPVNNLGIYIIDMSGRTVLQFSRSKATGIANFNLPIQSLAKGKYIVAVYDKEQLIASKELIKL